MQIGGTVQVSQKWGRGNTNVFVGTIKHIDYEFKNISARDWGKDIRYYIHFNDQDAYDRLLQRGSMLYILVNNIPKKCYIDAITDDAITVAEYSYKVIHPSSRIIFDVKKSRIESMLITETAYNIGCST